MAPVCAFQNLMVRSAVPPPLARRFRCIGRHDSALTAAWCWRSVIRGAHSTPRRPVAPPPGELPPARCAPDRAASQRHKKFSLPPEASVDPSADQLRPQTSCWWPTSVAVRCCRARASCCKTSASLDPLLTQRETCVMSRRCRVDGVLSSSRAPGPAPSRSTSRRRHRREGQGKKGTPQKVPDSTPGSRRAPCGPASTAPTPCATRPRAGPLLNPCPRTGGTRPAPSSRT